MDIFLGLVSPLLWPVLIVLVIVWLVKRSNKRVTSQPTVVPNENRLREKIAAEIRAQAVQYSTSAQKSVVEEMAQTVEYFASHDYQESQKEQIAAEENTLVAMPRPVVAATRVADSVVVEQKPYETPWKKIQLLDGATILLYLGAFFVLASIGLYVGFGAGTTIKALLVSLLTALFYGSGIVLFKKSKRLKPAGLTFAAIGMATLPMTGAALYYYALSQSHASAVWLVTSVIALGMYVHAMYVLRSSLVSYMVVFSTLSIVLSGISSIGLAPYYFIQGIGLSGLIFMVVAKTFGKSNMGASEAYERSSVFLVPFSMAMSVLFVVQVGWSQLALSLVVGAAYYAYMAYLTLGTKHVYTLLAQVMFIPGLVSGSYGLSQSSAVLRATLCVIIGLYICVWLTWASSKNRDDSYRKQIKGIVLSLPLALIGVYAVHTHMMWVAALAMVVAGLVVYAKDRDGLSGTEWLVGLLALPALVGYLGVGVTPLSPSIVGTIYVCLGVMAAAYRAIVASRMANIDLYFERLIVIIAVTTASFMQYGASNSAQVYVAVAVSLMLALQAWFESSQLLWLALSSTALLLWQPAFFDDPKVLSATLAGFTVYNLVLAQLKKAWPLHSWYASCVVLALPLVYGLIARDIAWGNKELLALYGLISLVAMAVRYSGRFMEASAASFTYLSGLVFVLGFSYAVGPHQGLIASCAVGIVLVIAERLEKTKFFGYSAPLIPTLVLFDASATSKLVLLMFGIVTGAGVAATIIRKRSYEAYISSIGLLIIPWFAGSVVYDWSSSSLTALYLGIATLLIAKRQLLKPYSWSPILCNVLRIAYMASLAIGLLYALGSGWKVTAAAYFVSGLLMVAISYIESSPATIVVAFALGYAAILRLTTGVELSTTYTVSLLLALTQSVYWLLVASKLSTKRAEYARSFQLCVALVIPLVGLIRPSHSIFPLSLALFGAMLAREVWSRGQTARETALLVVHTALLWWLFALGVREIQVYSQSTAAVIGLFALWRRVREDAPSVINQYLWMSVLIFSIPMVWQAVASGNPMYSYLVLVEHVVLIVASIIFKRATFAWWGIGVVVASVLYQLRTLRYAALAFLGAFIIALAVYFLLRYNKPGSQEK